MANLNLNQTRFLQPLRSNTVHSTIQAAIEDIEAIKIELSSSIHSDGISVVARYMDGNKIKSVLGIFSNTDGMYGFTYFVLDSDKMDALLERVNTLETKVGENSVIDTITTEIQNLDSTATSTNGNFVNITVVETDGKLTSASVDESALNTKIQAIEKSVADEASARAAADEALDGRLDIIEGEGEGSIKKAVADVVNGATEGYRTLSELETKIKALDDAVGEGGSVSTQIQNAINLLDSTATSTNGQLINITVVEENGKLSSASVNESALNTRIEAIEKSVSDEQARAKGVEEQLGKDIAAEATKAREEEGKLAQAIADVSAAAKSYEIVAIEGDELTALGTNVKEAWKLVDEDKVKVGSEIKIYKDSSLKSVTLSGQTLNFTYILANGSEDTVGVDISSFLAESEFANGLQVVDHVVSVKLAEGNESFLTVDANGVKLSGVQSAIDSAVAAEKGRAEGAESDLDARLDALETGDNSVAKQIENAISELNATVSTVREGETHLVDVEVVEEDGKLISATLNENVLNTRIQAIEKSVTDEASARTAADEALGGRLNAIEGDKTFVKFVNVNGVEATIADNKATVTIDGSDIKLSTDYTAVEYPSQVQDKFTSVVTGATVDAAINQVETNLSQLVQEVLDNEEVTAAAFTEIKESVGLDENLKYVANAESTYIKDATSFAEADSLLDAAIKNEVDSLNEKIDNVSNAAISIKEGEGISISENGTKKTINAVVKENDSLIEVTENGIGIKDAGYIDCGKF